MRTGSKPRQRAKGKRQKGASLLPRYFFLLPFSFCLPPYGSQQRQKVKGKRQKRCKPLASLLFPFTFFLLPSALRLPGERVVQAVDLELDAVEALVDGDVERARLGSDAELDVAGQPH